MDPELSNAEENKHDADIEQLDQVYSQLLPMKSEVFSSSSEDEDSEGDYEEFMDSSENEGPNQRLLKKRHASGTFENSSSSESAEDPTQDSDDDADASNEPTLDNCLNLNRVYQDLIRESIEDFELLLKLNKENQAALKDKMASLMTKKPANRNSIETFTFPYFKDSNYITPPSNEDTKIKVANGELISYVRQKKPWSESEKKRLLNAIKSNSMEKALQATMSRKEIIVMELNEVDCKLTDKEVAEKTKALKEKEKEMEALRKSVMKNPIGPIETDYDWMKISAVNFEGKRSATECKLFWRNYLHPSIYKSKWSKEEVANLEELVKQHGHHCWENIASLLKTNRTALQCFEKYQTTISKENLKGKWTIEEQERLKNLIDTFKIGNYIPWYKVFYFMEGRTGVQVWHHWAYRLNPSIKKGRWTEVEDLLLLSAVWILGPKNWWRIKEYVPGRTCIQCRDRWRNFLNPTIQLNKWTIEEDEKVKQLVQKHGRKWSLIARHLPGRTDGAIKTRYNSLTHHVNTDNTLSKHSEAGFSCYAQSHESYRTRIYNRLASATHAHIRKHGMGDAAELKSFSKEALVQNISTLALAPESKRQRYHRQPLDKKLCDFLGRLSVDDFTKMFNTNRVRKSTRPASEAVDKELDDYFQLANPKKKRGRPIRTVEFPDDDPGYKNWIEKYTDFIKNRPIVNQEASIFQNIPLLPPMTTTLQTFKKLLLQKKHMKALPMSRLPSSPHLGGSDQTYSQSDNSYELLFTRFTSLFFWPALLSVIKPEEEEPKEYRLSKRQRLQIVNELYRKKRKNMAAAEEMLVSESNLTAEQSCAVQNAENRETPIPEKNGESDLTVIQSCVAPVVENGKSLVVKKRLGRPRKTTDAESPTVVAEVVPTRRSSRLRRNNDTTKT